MRRLIIRQSRVAMRSSAKAAPALPTRHRVAGSAQIFFRPFTREGPPLPIAHLLVKGALQLRRQGFVAANLLSGQPPAADGFVFPVNHGQIAFCAAFVPLL
jgi:hypothetical protein